jgi:hypothetical protein
MNELTDDLIELASAATRLADWNEIEPLTLLAKELRQLRDVALKRGIEYRSANKQLPGPSRHDPRTHAPAAMHELAPFLKVHPPTNTQETKRALYPTLALPEGFPKRTRRTRSTHELAPDRTNDKRKVAASPDRDHRSSGLSDGRRKQGKQRRRP